MSTGLNSMTGVIFEDLIKPRCTSGMTELKASVIMKIIVFIIGLICIGLVFVVEKMGALVQASNSMSAITAGPLLGLFTLGMFFPNANEKGAIVGGIVSLATVAWISIGTQINMARGLIRFPVKPVSIDGCQNHGLDVTFHNITKQVVIPNEDPPFFMYRISYMYYTLVGFSVVLIVGNFVSYLTGGNKNKKLHKSLFTPVIHKFLLEDEVIDKNCSEKKNSIVMNNIKY